MSEDFIRIYDRNWVFIASKMWSMCLRTLIVKSISTNMVELILKINSQITFWLSFPYFHLSFFSFFHLKFLFNQYPHAVMTYHRLISIVKVKVAQSCPILCNPMDYTVHGILQARILEWVVFPFSRGSSQPRDWTQVSHNAGKFFTRWATGKPKNTGMGSLSLL